MQKLQLLILPLLIFLTTGCDYNDVDYPDTKLIKGQWQLIESSDTDNSFIYRFTTDSENTWSWGGVRLTPTEMWLKRFQKGLSDDIKKFIRRNDLPAPSKPQVWSD